MLKTILQRQVKRLDNTSAEHIVHIILCHQNVDEQGQPVHAPTLLTYLPLKPTIKLHLKTLLRCCYQIAIIHQPHCNAACHRRRHSCHVPYVATKSSHAIIVIVVPRVQSVTT